MGSLGGQSLAGGRSTGISNSLTQHKAGVLPVPGIYSQLSRCSVSSCCVSGTGLHARKAGKEGDVVCAVWMKRKVLD